MMIRDLIDLLDRSWSFLDQQAGEEFLFHCFPFFEQLLSDSRIAALLSGMRMDEQRSFEQYNSAQEKARTQLVQILDTLERSMPELFDEPQEERKGLDCSVQTLRQSLSVPEYSEIDDSWYTGHESKWERTYERPIMCLANIARKANCLDLVLCIQRVQDVLEYEQQRRRIFFNTSAATHFVRWERELHALHRKADDSAPPAWVLTTLRNDELARIKDLLFATRGRAALNNERNARAIEEHVARMRKYVKRIYEEIRHRLGSERSILAVFERYRQRCMWYEDRRLRQVAAHGPGKPEERLADTLLTYLFDHGLNPLTEPMVGRLRPDALGIDNPFSFYLEAKQYRSSCRDYLLDGVKQVWDMLDQLRGSRFDVKEAFYVVYRRGGPRYAFREPTIRQDDRAVHLMVVDISGTKLRGSNAPQTYVFETADLLPTSLRAIKKRTQRRPAKRRAV
jgi:hypothetical protein